MLVNQETGELKLLVKINAKAQGAEAKKSKAVKDLKQLSGEIGSFSNCSVTFSALQGECYVTQFLMYAL